MLRSLADPYHPVIVFATIYIQNFSLQAVLRHRPDAASGPVALVDPALSKAEIIQLTDAAKEYGVIEGMTASQSMARCQDLEILPRSPAMEESAKTLLLQTAFTFSPNIEYTQPGVCTLELKGLDLEARPALQRWCKIILQTFAQFHLQISVGVATTPALALLAAQSPDSITTIENPAEYVAHLPVAALSQSLEIMNVLDRWGIRTAGELIALGKDKIAARLGADALELFKRVSPTSNRPLKLVSPPEIFCEQVEFENEIESLQPLLLVLRRFVQQLLRRLDTIHLVVGRFDLCLGLSSGTKYEYTFKIPSPTSNENILFRMLHTHLEGLRTDAPILSVSLTATPVKPEVHQFGLFQNTLRNTNQFAETLARLAALVGPEHAGTPVPETTHRPDAFQMQPPNFEFIPVRSAPAESQGDGLQLRRFRPSLPAQVEFHKNKPGYIRSEQFTGQITGIQGPYLSSGNWWDESQWSREEWDIETANGRLLRLFRSGNTCFVEGVYD